jgi:mannose-6-phosphate isomerase
MFDKDRVSHISNSERVDKPWGYEVIWAKSDQYLGKIMVIGPGKRMSLQYHEKKEETIYVMNGSLRVWESNKDDQFIILETGNIYHVKPGQVHRFGADKTAVMLMEISTNYIDDVVRLSDDFKRENSENISS